MNIVVRKSTYADVPLMVAMGRDMHKESAFAPIAWDNEKTIRFTDRAIANNNFCVFVAEVNTELVGMIIGAVQDYYFSQETELIDFLWYVKPKYRGTTAGVELINSYVEFGKLKGCSEVTMRIGTNVHPEKTGKLLEKLNFTSVGGMYVRSVI
jgi:GNAT superfamily N-acetyltransferase